MAAGASAAGCVNVCEEEVGPTPLQQSSWAAIEKVFVVPPSLKMIESTTKKKFDNILRDETKEKNVARVSKVRWVRVNLKKNIKKLYQKQSK